MRISPVVRRTAVAAGAGVGTAGLLSGILLLGPKAASILLVVVFVLVWPLAAAIRHVADDAPYTSPLLVAVGAAGAVLCLPGVVQLLSWGATGLLVAVVTAALFALIELVVSRRGLSRRHDSSYGELSRLTSSELSRLSNSDDGADEKLKDALQSPLSIEELCGVWCETTAVLQQGAGMRDRQAVAEVRRICLDEFERRNPDGFQRWMEAGAPSNPGTFLLPKSDD
jgi:hypothetical protein